MRSRRRIGVPSWLVGSSRPGQAQASLACAWPTGVEPAGGGAPLRESARSALAGTMAAASQRPAGGRHGAVGARHWRVGPRVHTVRSRLASGLAARLLSAPHRRRPRSAVSQEAQRRQRAVASVKPGAARCFTRAALACCLRSAIDAPCLSRARQASPPTAHASVGLRFGMPCGCEYSRFHPLLFLGPWRCLCLLFTLQ